MMVYKFPVHANVRVRKNCLIESLTIFGALLQKLNKFNPIISIRGQCDLEYYLY